MKKYAIGLMLCVAIIAISVWAEGRKYSGETTITMAPTTLTVTAEIPIIIGTENQGIHGMAGKAILPASTYAGSAGIGAGLADSATIVLKSRLTTQYSTTELTMESLAIHLLPCTLLFNVQDDSLFLGEYFFDVTWTDSVVVEADSVSSTLFNYSMKAFY